jgi:hypothetical protein
MICAPFVHLLVGINLYKILMLIIDTDQTTVLSALQRDFPLGEAPSPHEDDGLKPAPQVVNQV